MPILKDHKHEAFCQFIVAGKNQDEAYKLAGYKPARQNAHRLMTKDYIKERIAQLQHVTVIEFSITAEQIARQLDEDRALAFEVNNPSAAVAATMGLAKLGGLLTDQSSVAISHSYASMTEEELRFELAALNAEALSLKPGQQH